MSIEQSALWIAVALVAIAACYGSRFQQKVISLGAFALLLTALRGRL